MTQDKFKEDVRMWFTGLKRFGPAGVYSVCTHKKSLLIEEIPDETIKTLKAIQDFRYTESSSNEHIDFVAVKGHGYLVIAFEYKEGQRNEAVVIGLKDYLEVLETIPKRKTITADILCKHPRAARQLI